MASPDLSREIPSSEYPQSAENFAILHDDLKTSFITAVNKLSDKKFQTTDMTETYSKPSYSPGKGFPADHDFYKEVYAYLLHHNKKLLLKSLSEGDGVTNSEVARYMITMADKKGVSETAKKSLVKVTPSVDKTIKDTEQSLSGLKQLITKNVQDTGKKTAILKEVDDIETQRESMTNDPTSFKDAQKDIKEVLDILPPEVDHIFAERMLNYLLVGKLIQQGVIPYIDTDGSTHLDFTLQCGEGIKAAWKGASNNADAFIPPERLKGFMTYTSTGQAPNQTIGVIMARLPSNTAHTSENILRAGNIPNSQKSLALTYIKNNNSTSLLDASVSQASSDAAQFSQANITDSMQMITDQTSRFENLAKKGKLPKTEKEIADFIRHPIVEAGRRFGAGGSILMLAGMALLAIKAGKMIAGKEAGWFGKSLGTVAALAAFSVGGNILGSYIENIPLEKIDPNKTGKEKEKLQAQFKACIPEFHRDIFPGLFVLSEAFGRDDKNRPFGERVTAEKFFAPDGSLPLFHLHPNIVDDLPELSIDGVKATPQALKAYKTLYRTVYYRRESIIKAQAAAPTGAPVPFNNTLLNPPSNTSLQQFLAGFYAETHTPEIPPAEGFDMSSERMKNFGLAVSREQTTTINNIRTKFDDPANTRMTMLPNPSTITPPITYDKKPKDVLVLDSATGTTDTLQIPVWNPAEAGNTGLIYEQIKFGGEYLLKVSDGGTPAKITECVLSETSPGSSTYRVSSMQSDGIAYSRP